VEYDLDSEAAVLKVLAWMGIERPSETRAPIGKREQRSKFERVPQHGSVNEYRNRGCRCPLCREASRVEYARSRGKDVSEVRRYQTKYETV